MGGEGDGQAVTFADLGVPGPLLRVLAADGKSEAFPIQADTLPDSLAGRDILGRGRTGSGKTLAFSIPLAARLMEAAWEPGMPMAEYRRNVKAIRREHLAEREAGGFHPHPRGLILAPTRELANQINEVIQPLAQMAGMTTTTVYGGVKQNRQVRDLMAGADIVVACPGRLEDLLNQRLLTLSDVGVVVLDEADEMADMGFLPQVRRILKRIPADAQHMLFSATLDHGVDELVREFLHDPKTHSVDDVNTEPDLMTQHVFEVEKADKFEVVRQLASGTGRRILFTRTKFQAKKLAKSLTNSGVPAAQLHGNLSQNQRDRNLAAFEQGDVNVMVATDVAARGIDVSGVELVVQVDPPADPKSFTHRSGRTARAGRAGDVVTLVLPYERREVSRLLKAAGITVRPVKVTHASDEVKELMGVKAPIVKDWSLDETQPAVDPRGGANAGNGRSGRSGAAKTVRSAGAARADRAKALAHMPKASSDGADRGRADAKEPGETRPDRRRRDRGRSEARRADSRRGVGTVSGRRSHGSKPRSGSASASDGGKRIHRHDENRIVTDERSEAVKRHERRMEARYGAKRETAGRRSAGRRRGRQYR
ncbi:DEAD/DEAH box helicase [Bifidobacterium sp. UTCIF-37]|uniref:DEAD/DEAH box helicase n=1 Tax=unclassified Bifidobacterium TaxID=2608897 RepID=UPI00112D0933|nr:MULTISPECIES: DEAD/DEAH box helicase [unclassified Bifidobacterium]TPF86405.1 DEAD/DEAH box helicase [Bifidobacterium sp. UTCIF-37]TPF88865.1 DEAD/DEAH box helicase [Bifidobacterium sp. UTCIF-38]